MQAHEDRKNEMENKIILLYWLRCRWRLKSYIKSVAVEIDFPCIYSI